MRIHWIPAIALSALVAAGCGNRGNQNDQTADQTKAAPAAAATPDQNQANREAVAPSAEPTATTEADRARPTTGTVARTRPSRETRTHEATGVPARRAEPQFNAPAGAAPAATAPREEFREVTIPAGTVLPLELLTPLASDTAQIETPVRARLRQAVTVDGFTAIPAGSTLTGTVTDVAESGRVSGRARLAFRFNEVEANGTQERISTNPLTYEAEATKGEDATKIGAGAGIGAAIGGLLGGGKGAAKGAVIGGAAGTGVVLATKGKDVTLAAGSDVAATLSSPLTLRVPIR